MTKVIFVCEGTCAGEAPTPLNFGEILKCKDKKCTKYTKPLTQFYICEKCWARYRSDKKHTCKKS